jgi:hypothetical protein
MPGPYHGWVYIKDRFGVSHEVINHARTSAYLSNPNLAFNGISICDIIDLGGCATYGLRPVCATPTWVANGAMSASAAAITPALPAGIQTNDILLLFLNTANEAITIPTPAGGTWTQVANTGGAGRGAGTAGSAGSTRGTVFWSRYNGTQTAPTTSDSGASQVGFIAAFRGCVTTGDPIDGSAGTATVPGAATTYSHNGVSTTKVNNLIVRAAFDGWANASTTRYSNWFVERFDNGNASFGGIGMVTQPQDLTAASAIDVTKNTAMTNISQVTIALAPAEWSTLTFSTPTADNAPWYNSSYPESADALGFFIEEWTGLDDAHVKRPTTAWGGMGGGASLGGVSAEGRTMAINLLLFGRTEEAVEYLFRWFAAAMTGVCQTCASDSILIRRFCGSTADPAKGIAELRRVGVIAGAKWESEPFGRAACYLRRASITLMAGDPCMYLPDTDRPVDAADYAANLHTCFAGITSTDPDRELCRPSCSELTLQACRSSYTFTVNPLGVIAPVVTWHNSSTQYSFPFRAVVYADPGNIGTTPNPCGLPILGELYVRPLPPSTSLRWNVATREVEVRDAASGGFTAGWAYVEPNDPPRKRFFAVPCGKAHLVMEPSSACIENPTGTTWTLDEMTFNPPAFPTVVDIRLQERVSCA